MAENRRVTNHEVNKEPIIAFLPKAIVLHAVFLLMFINICLTSRTLTFTKKTATTVTSLTFHNSEDTEDREENFDLRSDSSSKDVTELLKRPIPEMAKIHREPSVATTASCPHTMVTAYFPIPSKHTSDQYLKWMANFLSLQECMVIFTSSDMVEPIRQIRSATPLPTQTVLVEMSLNDLPLAELEAEFWEHQLAIDPEQNIHRSYQLFWIWLSKSWCVVQAIQQDFFGSRNDQHNNTNKGLFMWQDIGSYRVATYNGQKILVHTNIVPPKTILWLAHHRTNPPPDPIWNAKDKYFFHSGSQGAGDAVAWLEYHEKFARTIQQFLDRDMFIGEDQCVLQSTCQQYPNLCAYISAKQVNDNHYFGLRYAFVKGGTYNLWRMPTVG